MRVNGLLAEGPVGLLPVSSRVFLRHATVYGAMKSIGQQQRPRRSGAAGDETALVLKARLGSDSRVAVGSVFNRRARRYPEFRQLMRQPLRLIELWSPSSVSRRKPKRR